jgi:hypothetical protein
MENSPNYNAVNDPRNLEFLLGNQASLINLMLFLFVFIFLVKNK